MISQEGQKWMVTIIGLIEIGSLIAITYFLSQLVGNPDNGNDLAKTVVPISCGIGAVIILHTLMWYMYFQYNEMAMNLYFLITGSMCMIFSLTALAISLVQRS
jgi:hypothetical protein